MEAGQYCTFVLHNDGRVSGCGKGSYGRLGLGDSTNQLCPKSLPISTPVKALTSSRGSDGHTLALTEDGNVYSWGDGKNCLSQANKPVVPDFFVNRANILDKKSS